MVQDILQAILPPILADLREWTTSLRFNAARCLHSVLLLSGPSLPPHLPRLLSPLCSAAGDEDAQVAVYVVQAAQVLQVNNAGPAWKEPCIETVAKCSQPSAVLVCYLAVGQPCICNSCNKLQS